jgi:hypothetical protein
MAEKEKLLWEIAREKAANVDKSATATEASGFSQDEANELEELLKTIIGNKA